MICTNGPGACVSADLDPRGFGSLDPGIPVEEEAFLCAGHAKDQEATTKTSSLSGAGAAQLFNRRYPIQNGLSHDSAPRTLRDMKLSFLGELTSSINTSQRETT